MDKNFLVDHYKVILDVWFIALMAFLIFFMHFTRGAQIGSLIVASVLFIWMFHSARPDEPPCGSEVSGEPVSRSKGGFEPSAR